jgi:hypothetical protein
MESETDYENEGQVSTYLSYFLQRPDRQPSNNKDPHCNKCWDKGYASYMEAKVEAQGKSGSVFLKRFCQNCWRGRRMEIDDAYNRGYAHGTSDARMGVIKEAGPAWTPWSK